MLDRKKCKLCVSASLAKSLTFPMQSSCSGSSCAIISLGSIALVRSLPSSIRTKRLSRNHPREGWKNASTFRPCCRGMSLVGKCMSLVSPSNAESPIIDRHIFSCRRSPTMVADRWTNTGWHGSKRPRQTGREASDRF